MRSDGHHAEAMWLPTAAGRSPGNLDMAFFVRELARSGG
jgi:hypothetical protein